MAEQSLTYVCCAGLQTSVTDCVPGLGANCSGGAIIVTVTSVTSPNTFGMFTNSYLLSRTCADVQNCLPGLGACSGNINVIFELACGCFPKSLFPITINYTIAKTGVGSWSSSKSFNSGSPGVVNCSPAGSVCEEICVLS